MRRILILSMLLVLAVASVSSATTIIINNQDGVNEGLNDTTPVAPIGGNPGTTLGQQRLNVFLAAGQIWGQTLPSHVTIDVEATFDPLTPCDSTSGVLGSAGAASEISDFPGALVSNTWY